MGRFAVNVKVANFADMANARNGLIEPRQVRRARVKGTVDPGATSLVLPQVIIARLGLATADPTEVRYADGRTATRDTVQGVYVEILGRHTTIEAIVEPNRRTALIGAVVLELLDLLVDCKHQRLIPRDPRHRIYEIE